MSELVRCIGITGLNGAGKTTTANFLKSNYDVGHYEVRKLLNEERITRLMPEGRKSLQVVANMLRKEHGPDYIMRTLAEQAMMSKDHNPFTIESVRCVGEIDYLSATFGESFVLIGVDAYIETRYERARKRGSQTDVGTFEKFCNDEAVELAQDNPWEQNLRSCMDRVKDGYQLWNDGTESLFHSQLRLAVHGLGLEPKTGPQKTA